MEAELAGLCILCHNLSPEHVRHCSVVLDGCIASAPCGDAFLILWYQQNDTTLSCSPKVMVQNRACNRFDVNTKIKLIAGFDLKQTIHTPSIKLVLLHKNCVRFLKINSQNTVKWLCPSCWSSLCAKKGKTSFLYFDLTALMWKNGEERPNLLI